jgi:uncharacterized protein YegP (UPF0339 family)
VTDEVGPKVVNVHPSKSGSGYYWSAVGGNGEVMATSGSETYEHPTDAKSAVYRLFGEDIAVRIFYKAKEDEGGE